MSIVLISINNKISVQDLQQMADESFGDMVKAVVDIEKLEMTVGGELHSDEESFLIESGSRQENLWGINLYPAKPRSEWIEFDSLINIRPRQNNRSRNIENEELRKKIIDVVQLMVI